MESTDEQWNPEPSIDIISKSWLNIADAKKAVKIWILDRGESWAPSNQSNKTRLQLHCLLSSCPFYIGVGKKNDGSFRVTSFTPHNCPPSTHTQFKPRSSAWYIASRFERDITINRHIKPKEIQERAGIYHQLQNIQYKPAWRAREHLRNILDGDEGSSFGLILDWCRRIMDDSTTEPYIATKLSADMRFEALFIMIGAVRANLPSLRPFYALDGTHTRSQYNLTLLITVGIDAEDRILPLAFALVPGENETWWSWFCDCLVQAFDHALPPQYVIISDRDKGLVQAVDSKLPGAYHAMCCQHIAENIHKRFGKDYKARFWQIARASTRSAFDIAVQALQRDAPEVEEYMSSIGYNTFAFACFPHPRFGHDTSNIVESMNSVWRDIRELPPLQLINGIYQWYIKTFYKRRNLKITSGNSMLSNSAYRAYKSRESLTRSYHVLAASETSFLVTITRGAQFLVNLPVREIGEILGSCSCKKYHEYLAPCSHAIACILHIGQNPYEYFSMCYGWETSKLTYEKPIKLVTIQGLEAFRDNAGQQVLPPIKRPKRGRPKVARIRPTYQEEKRIYICSVCHQSGHNRRLCPNQPVEHGRAQRARDQLVEGRYLNPIMIIY
jgi:MULE transposase domain